MVRTDESRSQLHNALRDLLAKGGLADPKLTQTGALAPLVPFVERIAGPHTIAGWPVALEAALGVAFKTRVVGLTAEQRKVNGVDVTGFGPRLFGLNKQDVHAARGSSGHRRVELVSRVMRDYWPGVAPSEYESRGGELRDAARTFVTAAWWQLVHGPDPNAVAPELSDPELLGVHPALQDEEQADLPYLTPYIARATDSTLRQMLADLRDARTSGLVTLIGESSTGKTRTAYEAIRAELADWRFHRPRNQSELQTALLTIESLAPRVVWLDELQDFLVPTPDRAVIVEGLLDVARGQSAGPPSIYLATIWPSKLHQLTAEHSASPNELSSGRLTALLRTVRPRAVVIPNAFQPEDHQTARALAESPWVL